VNIKNNRIDNLDFIRGIAILGILIMNSVVFALPESALWNHSSAGTENFLDWILVFFSVIFIDGKMMGLFSALFAVGLVLFVESANRKGYRIPVLLSLWRNLLLFCFGMIHIVFMYVYVDILWAYAVLSPAILFLRNKRISLLLGIFFATIFISIFTGFFFQSIFDSNGNLISEMEDIFTDKKGLGSYWFSNSEVLGDAIGTYFVLMYFFRIFSLMLLGLILYKLNVIQGSLSKKTYKKIIYICLPVGLSITLITPVWLNIENYDPEIAVMAYLPIFIGTYPLVIGYVSLLSLIYTKISRKISGYLKDCGRMAFTNYITQSLFGMLVFYYLFEDIEFTRKEIIIFVLVVWIIQIIWSKLWLKNFNQGPLEWFWRKLTYIKR